MRLRSGLQMWYMAQFSYQCLPSAVLLPDVLVVERLAPRARQVAEAKQAEVLRHGCRRRGERNRFICPFAHLTLPKISLPSTTHPTPQVQPPCQGLQDPRGRGQLQFWSSRRHGVPTAGDDPLSIQSWRQGSRGEGTPAHDALRANTQRGPGSSSSNTVADSTDSAADVTQKQSKKRAVDRGC